MSSPSASLSDGAAAAKPSRLPSKLLSVRPVYTPASRGPWALVSGNGAGGAEEGEGRADGVKSEGWGDGGVSGENTRECTPADACVGCWFRGAAHVVINAKQKSAHSAATRPTVTRACAVVVAVAAVVAGEARCCSPGIVATFARRSDRVAMSSRFCFSKFPT